jgi:hypothetical protein
VVLVQQDEKRLQSTSAENMVTAFGRVTSDVSKGPNAEEYSACRKLLFVETHACSRTSSTLEDRSWMKRGTALAAMTTCVCSEVPEAMS